MVRGSRSPATTYAEKDDYALRDYSAHNAAIITTAESNERENWNSASQHSF
jgi:hypothetical protein